MSEDNDDNLMIESDPESMAMLDEYLTQEEQVKLIEFFQTIQEELLGVHESGEVEINWDTREIHAFPGTSTVPYKTWKLDEVLNGAESLH